MNNINPFLCSRGYETTYKMYPMFTNLLMFKYFKVLILI